MEDSWLNRDIITGTESPEILSDLGFAYLQQLLYPIQTKILEIGLRPWYNTIPPTFVNEFHAKYRTGGNAAIINYLGEVIISNTITRTGRKILLPWDVFIGIMGDPDLVTLFNFQPYVKPEYSDSTVLLLVSIEIDIAEDVRQKFTHNLTREQFLGMSLIAYEHDDIFSLSMFNAYLDPVLFFTNSLNPIIDVPRGNYTAEYLLIDEYVTITFNNPTFIQGHLSACSWLQLPKCQDQFLNIRQWLNISETEGDKGRSVRIQM